MGGNEKVFDDVAEVLSSRKSTKIEIKSWLEMAYKLGKCDGHLESIKQQMENNK